MNSRIILLAIIAVLAAALISPAAPARAAEPPAKPNIVFIIADDMGWSDLSCYGNKYIETPHIDRLARQGVRFTDFYAGTPVCSSTRSSIFSGQYAARVGITDFIPGHWRPFEKLVVPPIENALPKSIVSPGAALKAAGYHTAYFGKWHLGPEPANGPEAFGFDTTARTIDKGFNAWRDAHGESKPGKPDPKRINLLTDQAMYFIGQRQKVDDEKPFFITVSHHAVHIRIEAEAALVEKYEKKPRPDNRRIYNPGYAAMTQHLDGAVGRMMKQLDELGVADNTLFIFTSDNGGLTKIYTGVGEEVTDNKPLRDEKGTIYEGGIRVPLIVRWPGVVEPGGLCKEVTISNDFMPTFMAAAGATEVKTQPLDGLSLLPVLKDPAASLDREAIFFHYPHYHHSRPAGAIRHGDWKLIEYFGVDGPESLELYHLRDDRGETKNLSEALPDIAAHFQAKLAAWRKQVGARMPTPNPNHDPARAAQWWNKRTNEPLDIEDMRRRYESRKQN